MTNRRRPRPLTALLWVAWCPALCGAQGQIQITTPGHGMSSGFSENIGVQWGAQQFGPQGGWYFHSGGPAAPPLGGGIDPGGQASLQFGGRAGNATWGLGITAGQGSSQSLSSQAPSIVLPNGGLGFFSNTLQTPFVTGLVPVLGSGSYSPVRERWRRLQYERATAAVTSARDQVGDEVAADEPPPAVPPPPRERRRDDAPLILGKPSGRGR